MSKFFRIMIVGLALMGLAAATSACSPSPGADAGEDASVD